MRINANIAALNAQRNLGVSQGQLGKSLEKLSSGFRINRAADDAAGLAISEGLRSEIRGNAQAQRNAQDGISFLQTAEGAMTEVHSMLQRMRELAVQASNATSTGVAENGEAQELLTEITAIGARTKFSGNAVFQDYSAAGASLNFQVSASGVAGEQVQYSKNLTLSATSIAGVAVPAISLDGGVGATPAAKTLAAQKAITDIDAAIKAVSQTRADLGATQNRLEHTVSNLGVSVENLTASESRIRDVDMAEEMVTFTRNNILSQAGTAMLAQANQVPQSILQLLR